LCSHGRKARPQAQGAEPVPGAQYLFDPETGEPGDRNGVFATALEHKMGLTASATCELAFGQHGVPAVGWLVGDTHRGIAQMFGIMLYARLMVGIKSIATLSSGYLNALEFAKTRVQGPDLTRMSTSPPARAHHQPPRCAAVTVDPEGVCRKGFARCTCMPRPIRIRFALNWFRTHRRNWRSVSTILLLPIVKGGDRSVRSVPRRIDL